MKKNHIKRYSEFNTQHKALTTSYSQAHPVHTDMDFMSCTETNHRLLTQSPLFLFFIFLIKRERKLQLACDPEVLTGDSAEQPSHAQCGINGSRSTKCSC